MTDLPGIQAALYGVVQLHAHVGECAHSSGGTNDPIAPPTRGTSSHAAASMTLTDLRSSLEEACEPIQDQ
jgi:hypothetical protein